MSAEEILSAMMTSLKSAVQEPFHTDAEKQMKVERFTGALIFAEEMGALSEEFHEHMQYELQNLKARRTRRGYHG